MAKFIRPKPGLVLSSSHVVRALSEYGPHYHCADCGSKMFVRYESGLCPRCFNGHRAKNEAVSQLLYDFERAGTDDLHD